ncbi:MAG TPA: cupredoxin domain-containing protein [Gaiellaceae bacterium]|nr:cupredoxin domain-containing protein [Gaiellaceae bacterium]
MKRIVSLLLAAAVAAVTLFVVAPFAVASSTATAVKVIAKDFRFTLSRKTAPHGKVVFNLVNRGPSPHDFKIAGKKTKVIKKGKTATLTVTLIKGKTYTYICTVPGHARLGMKGKFKAT